MTLTLAALVAFLIFSLVVLLIAYAVVFVVDKIEGLPPPAKPIVRLIVGVIALLVILQKAVVLFGIKGL